MEETEKIPQKPEDDGLAAVTRCIQLYNQLGEKDRKIVGLAIVYGIPMEELEKLESNPRTDFMKAYYGLSDIDKDAVTVAILFSPMNAQILLIPVMPQPNDNEG